MTKGTKLSDLNYEIGGLILPSSKETDYKNLLYTQANDFQPETLKRRNKAGSGLRTDRFINIENSETPFDFDGTSLGAANKIELCQKAYYNFGLLRNTIDIMSELANSQIFIEKGDKNTRHLVKNWLKAINIWKVKDQFFREYFRSGNVFFYSFKGKIDINSSNKLKEIYGKEIEDIPLRYILLNPADIRVTASSSFVEADYHKVLNYYELSRLRHPKTEIDKKTFESLPKEIQEQIQTEMVPYLRLEPSNLNVIFYKKQDYEPFAIPFAWPVLEDINAKIELKRIDMAVARTAERALLLITAGAKEEDGGVNPKTISQLQSLFSSESVIRTLIADYTVKGQWILPDLNKILTEEKYKQIDKDIATALNALFFNSEEKFANINIKVQVFIERLNEARNAFLEEFLNPEIENLCKKVRAQNVPVIKFENISLKDEVQYIRVFTRMAELGIITPDQLMEAIDNGRLPSTSEQIEEGQQKFIEQKEKGYFRPLISGNVGNEGGRPAGTDGVPQTTKNISPLGGGQSNANIHQSDLNKSILLYNKILNSLETIAKEKFSVDNFDNNQEEMISLAARSILVNNGNNYKDVVNKYFDDPKFISEKNQLEIDELMLEHNINETQACILYYAKKINISFLMLVCTLLFGCASKTKYVEKQSEPASQAAYAVADAIEKGRVDAAERYAQELKRLIEKPKQEIRVAEVVIPVTPQPSIIEELAQGAIKTEVQENNTNRPVELKYQKYVILPESYRDREIVIFNTEEFNALINEHENVKKLFELEKQNFSNFVKDVDKQKKINNEVQNQLIKDLERARSEAAKYKALSAKYQQYYYFFWGSITFVGMLIVLFLLIRFGKFFM